MKRTVAALVIVVSALTGGSVFVASNAHASGTPDVQTEYVTESLVNSHCYVRHSVTVTYMHWDTKLNRYVNYVSPRITTHTAETCH